MTKILRFIFSISLIFLIALLLVSCKKVEEIDSLEYTVGDWEIIYKRDPSTITHPDGYDAVDIVVMLEEPDRGIYQVVKEIAPNTFRLIVKERISCRPSRPSTIKNEIIVRDYKLYNQVDQCSVKTGENITLKINGFNVVREIFKISCPDKKASYLMFYIQK